jgi:hypothetical protein
VVEVSVTQDQGVGLGRVDVEHLVVVGETLRSPGEVEQDLLPFISTDRRQMVGQSMLGEWHRQPEGGALDRHRPHLPTLGKDIVEIVHHVGHDELVDGRDRGPRGAGE